MKKLLTLAATVRFDARRPGDPPSVAF